MKIYPENLEEKIGFDQIRSLLIGYCQSEKGTHLAQKAKPTNRFDLLQKWHHQVDEMLRLKINASGKMTFLFPDIEPLLKKIKIAGSFLDPQAFHQLKGGTETLISWIAFFSKNGANYPELSHFIEKIELEDDLAIVIDRVVDERGEVRDDASRELSQIRQNIIKSEKSVRSAVQKVLQKAKNDQITDEESSLTVRDGRLVIPIKAEYKKQFQGFVHDESATGQTVFMEPGEVLSLNNAVRELKNKERRELIRILTNLSDKIRDNMPGLERGVGLLEKLDFINAKTRLASELDATVPFVQDKRQVNLINAIHPILYLNHKNTNKPVIPLTLQLDYDNRILIISGPNAGGKSVTLKTVGLLQYMVQCGLPVPVADGSEFGVFSSIFVDIGDTQSIEDDLSTYSAHLVAMKAFVEGANKKSMFLIDEFGKGTEPQFGGAMAASILAKLNQAKAFGVVTTHYQNLKKMGEDTRGLVNGAMKYDVDKLEPLFIFEAGKPGSSYAFEIAQKIGLPTNVISDAKKEVGSTQVEYDELLGSLEKEKSKYQKLSQSLEKDRDALAKVKKEYESIRDMVGEEKKRIIKSAKTEAKQILDRANKDVERTIREIRENNAAKKQTQKAREILDRKKNALKEVAKQPKNVIFNEGDAVKVNGQESVGTIKKIKGKQAEVFFGGIKTIVSIGKLVPAKHTPVNEEQMQHQKRVKKLGINLNDKMVHFTHELNLLGMRAEEAMVKVNAFLDEALLLGVDEVKIVHGKGAGVLREVVRNCTKDHSAIESVADEHADRGGAGISIVRFK